jgi:hypothetical protein
MRGYPLILDNRHGGFGFAAGGMVVGKLIIKVLDVPLMLRYVTSDHETAFSPANWFSQ